MNSRAASEIVIRQALAELDIWEVESKFPFMLHLDSTGSDINLIKDFKDILSKVHSTFALALGQSKRQILLHFLGW